MGDTTNLMDKIDIQELLAKYALTVDTGDAKGFGALFTEQAQWIWEAFGLKFKGRKTLEDLCRAIDSSVPGAYHMSSAPVITLGQDQAETTCQFTVFLSRPEKIYTLMAGRYKHALKKVNGQWLIHRLWVHVENPEILSQGKIGEYYAPLIANLPPSE